LNYGGESDGVNITTLSILTFFLKKNQPISSVDFEFLEKLQSPSFIA